MKSFIASMILAVIVLSAVVANYFYINNVANTMRSMLEEAGSMPNSRSEEQADALIRYWEKAEPIVGLSTEYPILDRIKEQALLLRTAAQTGDVFGYCAAYAMLLDALEDMGRQERFSVGNLF